MYRYKGENAQLCVSLKSQLASEISDPFLRFIWPAFISSPYPRFPFSYVRLLIKYFHSTYAGVYYLPTLQMNEMLNATQCSHDTSFR